MQTGGSLVEPGGGNRLRTSEWAPSWQPNSQTGSRIQIPRIYGPDQWGKDEQMAAGREFLCNKSESWRKMLMRQQWRKKTTVKVKYRQEKRLDETEMHMLRHELGEGVTRKDRIGITTLGEPLSGRYQEQDEKDHQWWFAHVMRQDE